MWCSCLNTPNTFPVSRVRHQFSDGLRRKRSCDSGSDLLHLNVSTTLQVSQYHFILSLEFSLHSVHGDLQHTATERVDTSLCHVHLVLSVLRGQKSYFTSSRLKTPAGRQTRWSLTFRSPQVWTRMNVTKFSQNDTVAFCENTVYPR